MTRWYRLRHRDRMEEQLDRELRFHLDHHAADLVAAGCSPEEAQRLARLAIGGPEQVKEECRDARGTRCIEDLWQDCRYALRNLRQRPGFTVVALLTLALGIGATTVMFTVIDGVLLKPLPFPHPDRLVELHEKTEQPTQFGDIWAFAYPNYLDCRRESRTLQMAAHRFSGGTLSGRGDAEYLDGFQISPELFSVMGVPLERGREFLPEEDRPGAAPVIIISYSLWQRRFAGSPGAVNTSLTFDGKSYRIVGIAPAGFKFPQEADVFTPLGQNTMRAMQNREAHPGIQVVARLRPGRALSEAQSELAVISHHLAAQYPKSNAGRGVMAESLHPDVTDVRSTLWLLLGAVGLVLLIACINVASLLLARAVSRDREFAMRAALGAGRGRLMRQCLTESAVLGLAGGVFGIALANLGIRPFIVFWPGTLPRAEEVHLDWRMLLFALAVSLLSGLLLGMAPALRVPTRELEPALRAGSRTVVGRSGRLHSGLVMTEIALAVVLLVSAAILGRTILRLSAVDPGLNVRNVLTARMALSPATLQNPGQIRAAWRDVLDHARRVPGVESAAMVDTVPMRAGNNQIVYWATPALPLREQMPVALASSVTPDYLKVMGIALRGGRFFNDQDRMGSEPVVVIDDMMAQHAFGANEPVGKSLWIPDMGDGPLRVVGVVSHVRYWGLAGDERAQVHDQLYYPFAQVPDPWLRRWSEVMSIAVRTNVRPLSLVDSLKHEVRGNSGDQVLYEVRTMEELASGTLARQRFLLLLFGVFAGLALLLASIGIYGVLAYLTSQRVPEIGIRMALGASGRDCLRLILGHSLTMVLGGVAIGMAAAWAAGRVLEQLVAGVRSSEPLTFAMTIAVVMIAAMVASFLPARRASQVDPVRALRQE